MLGPLGAIFFDSHCREPGTLALGVWSYIYTGPWWVVCLVAYCWRFPRQHNMATSRFIWSNVLTWLSLSITTTNFSYLDVSTSTSSLHQKNENIISSSSSWHSAKKTVVHVYELVAAFFTAVCHETCIMNTNRLNRVSAIFDPQTEAWLAADMTDVMWLDDRAVDEMSSRCRSTWLSTTH